MANPIADPLVEGPDTDTLSDLVTIEDDGAGAVTVMLNRAARRNALNGEMIAALREAFETLHGADGVRVVFLAGAGEAFSIGADLAWVGQGAGHFTDDNRDDAMQMAIALKHLHDLPALTVALVQGEALGGGAGLVAACDMAIAAADAQFGFAEVKSGLVAATISPYVVAAIGPRRARGLLASGRRLDAETARVAGLIDEVVADAAALAVARDRLAAQAVDCAPQAVAESKRLVDHVAGRAIDHGLMEETAKLNARVRVGDEAKEGVRAALEGRKPNWAAR